MSNEVQMTDEAQKARIAAVYEKYGADLRKAAQNLLGDCPNAEYDAEEAVQNAFIRIIEGPWACPDTEEKLYAGFMILVCDEAAKLASSARGEAEICPFTDELLPTDGLGSEATGEDLSRLLLDAIMRLKERYRTVLILRCIRRLSVREISQRLNMKPKTVYTNITRGKAQLRRLLEQRPPRKTV